MNTRQDHDRKNERRTTMRPFALVAAMGALGLFSAAAVAVESSPAEVEFNSNESSASLRITHNGKPVDASAIKSVKLYASGHDYDHMIDVAKADGKVTVRPTKMLQIGSYDIVIDTAHGKATTALMAPLDELYSSLESRSERLGITVDELKARLGLTQTLGQEHIDLGLPKVHYVGHTLSVPIDRAPNRTYAWSVNGVPIEIGQGDRAMTYTFMEPGIYDFTYLEMEGGEVVATGFGATNVVPEPAVHELITTETTAKLIGPAGYGHYDWAVDGNPTPADKTLHCTFETPGEHIVTLRAHHPLPGTEMKFREITYVITVS